MGRRLLPRSSRPAVIALRRYTSVPLGAEAQGCEAALQLLADNEAAIKRLCNRLHWYIKNDEVNLDRSGDEYWIGGFYRACRALSYVAQRRFTKFHVEGETPAPLKPEFGQFLYPGKTRVIEAYLGDPDYRDKLAA